MFRLDHIGLIVAIFSSSLVLCCAYISSFVAWLRIPVMWALDSGDVGKRRSEATLVEFYSIQVAHMSQEKGK
jgi:hypothetical protein